MCSPCPVGGYLFRGGNVRAPIVRAGKEVMSSTTTRSSRRNGSASRYTWMRGFSNRHERRKGFMPTGGVK